MTLAKAVAKVRETSGQQPGVCLPSIHKTLLFIALWLEWMEYSESSNAPLLFNFSGLNNGYIGTMASACLTIGGWHCLWSHRRGQYGEGKPVGKGRAGLFIFYFLFFFLPLFMKQIRSRRQFCLYLLEADVYRNMKYRTWHGTDSGIRKYGRNQWKLCQKIKSPWAPWP